MQVPFLVWCGQRFGAPAATLAVAFLAGCAGGPAATPAKPPAAAGATQGTGAETARPAAGSDQAAAASNLEKLPPTFRASIASGAYPNATPPPRAGVEPPDGVWLKDDQGQEFYIEKWPRYEGKYKWLDDHRINYMGVKVDIVDSDEETFSVKVYRVKDWDRVARRAEPTAEEKAAVAATYVAQEAPSDRLTFESFDSGLPRVGQWRNGFQIYDLNGDGHLDIVHAPPRKGVPYPVVFLGDGAGGWKPWRQMSFPAQYDYGDIAVGDLNGDGNADLVLAIHLRGLRALVGDGQGHFKEWSQGIDYQVPGQGGDGEGFSSRAVRIVDFDGDGRPDILALGEGPRVGAAKSTEFRTRGIGGGVAFVADGPVVFLNQGDGTWKKLARGADTQEIFGDDLAVADFNRDGHPDFVTSSNRMSRFDLLNLSQDGKDWEAEILSEVRPNAYVRAVAAADLNGDGRQDVVVGYLSFELAEWRSGVDVLFGQPDGGWERRPLIARPGRQAFNALAAGDLDGDHNQDIVAVDGDGTTAIYLGDGKGWFTSEATPELASPLGKCRAYRVRLADLDGDGRDEIVANFADEADAYYDPQRCLNGGAIGAWKAVAKGK